MFVGINPLPRVKNILPISYDSVLCSVLYVITALCDKHRTEQGMVALLLATATLFIEFYISFNWLAVIP